MTHVNQLIILHIFHRPSSGPVKIRRTIGPQARKSAQTRREAARRPDVTEKGKGRREGREGREGKRVLEEARWSLFLVESNEFVFSPRHEAFSPDILSTQWRKHGQTLGMPIMYRRETSIGHGYIK